MKFVSITFILISCIFNLQAQIKIHTKEQLAINLISRIETLSGKALEKIKSGNLKAYFNDTTPIKFEDLAWFHQMNKPKGFLAEYKETHIEELNKKIFDFKGVWIVTNFVHSSGIELMTEMPAFYIKSEDMKQIFSKDEIELIVLLSDFLFGTDLSINILNESSIIDSKQEMINRRIEKNIIRQVNLALLDSFNLSILTANMLQAIAKNCALFRKADIHQMTNFYSDIKLTNKISSDELDDLLKERYPYKGADTVIYSPFDFQEAISIT